jgi:PAS domain S-box-containing protein
MEVCSEVSITRFNRYLLSYGAAILLSSLAVALTYYIPVFGRIPWTLSFLSIATVAWMGGGAPTLVAALITTCGIYGLVLAPAHPTLFDPVALTQAIAFDLGALLITSLLIQRNRAISSLEASEMHYRSVTETASDVVITIDSDSCILSINPAVKEVFGYEPGELIGEQMPILMPEEFRAAHKDGIARYLIAGARHIPWTGIQLPGRRKDGEEIPLEISFGSYTAGGEKRFTGFIRDISDRREAEAALLKSEKLAAVGRLASSIAHEINNPLEAITNLLYLCQGSEEVKQIQMYLEIAEREVRRISVIANQTLQFHKQSSTPEIVQCQGLVDGSLALYQGRLVNASISVEQRHRAERLPICVEGEIRQVLNNLLGNAIDALPARGGRLLIRTRDATDWKNRRQGVILTIADTGTGMSSQTQRKLFEAFFTTKGIGGTGLGLWISYQLVGRNEGKLRVRSSQRHDRSGTVFTLFLPCLENRLENH